MPRETGRVAASTQVQSGGEGLGPMRTRAQPHFRRQKGCGTRLLPIVREALPRVVERVTGAPSRWWAVLDSRRLDGFGHAPGCSWLTDSARKRSRKWLRARSKHRRSWERWPHRPNGRDRLWVGLGSLVRADVGHLDRGGGDAHSGDHPRGAVPVAWARRGARPGRGAADGARGRSRGLGDADHRQTGRGRRAGRRGGPARPRSPSPSRHGSSRGCWPRWCAASWWSRRGAGQERLRRCRGDARCSGP